MLYRPILAIPVFFICMLSFYSASLALATPVENILIAENTESSNNLKELEKRAKANDVEAQFDLGLMYITGSSVEKNTLKAKQYFEMAAKLGNKDAQYLLGGMYANGVATAKNYEKAMHWLELSAKQGLAEAQYYVGVLYEDGRGIPQDYKKAIEYYEMAAEKGYSDAKKMLEQIDNL